MLGLAEAEDPECPGQTSSLRFAAVKRFISLHDLVLCCTSTAQLLDHATVGDRSSGRWQVLRRGFTFVDSVANGRVVHMQIPINCIVRAMAVVERRTISILQLECTSGVPCRQVAGGVRHGNILHQLLAAILGQNKVCTTNTLHTTVVNLNLASFRQWNARRICSWSFATFLMSLTESSLCVDAKTP